MTASKADTSRASTIPKYTFAKTLAEQEDQLKSNPMMERFAASRKSLSSDPYRPTYHYVNPENDLNDPNGLCYWQDRWHLFYQGYPDSETTSTESGSKKVVHWGHAVSDDLVHWRDLPYAIYPDPEESCFSGATLVENDRVIAMYHGVGAGNMIALSDDPLLLNWEKVTGQAVIPIAQPDGSPWPYRVFDPCIWKKDNVYYALSGGTLPHEPTGRRTRANFLFKSNDLESWEYLHPFIEGDSFTLVGDDGACPYFWPIGKRHILLFFSHMSGGQTLIGDYDKSRDKFVVTAHHDFNFGAFDPGGVHAPSATPDGKGGVIAIFNMNPAMDTKGWNQIMTLPRHLSLLGDNKIERDRLKIEPAGDIESLRSEHKSFKDIHLSANNEVVIHEVQGSAMEIITEIEINASPMIELNVLRSPNKEEFTRIAFYANRGYRDWERYDQWESDKRLAASEGLITIDSSYSSVLPDVLSRAPETGPVFLDTDENLKLRVFIDKSIVEVFVNSKQCIAMRVYPGRSESTGISLRSQGKDAKIKTLDTWQMKDIYSD